MHKNDTPGTPAKYNTFINNTLQNRSVPGHAQKWHTWNAYVCRNQKRSCCSTAVGFCIRPH